MTHSATNFDTLTGRDPAGRPAYWQVQTVDTAPGADSLLVTSRVKTHDGTTLLHRTLPDMANPVDLALAELLLDNEIRALTRLHARYAVPLPELPRLVGYDFDSAEPFVLLEPPAGRSVSGGLRTLLIDERRRFLIGLFRALAELAAVDLVHGSVGLSSLCWDGHTTQLINLEHTVNTGEASRSSLSRNGGVAHPGDDVLAAGRVVYELFTGKRVDLGDAPDLSSQPEVLAALLDGVFEARPDDRPTAVQVLERLNDRDPLPRPVDVAATMQAGYERFDQLHPPRAVAPTVAAPRPPVVAPAPSRPFPWLPVAVLVVLVIAVVWVIL
ncbi:hypothetical protein [Lentzea flava]|uniref:Protein kinase domain-containing protein n=1 Tax=Lentzea flava TaxID=103732 RepID=A0ABQ2VDE3_9PSEU|nr:hypothetical protein [Lentzea flava]MCP2204627.1 hypothetical protein [Lentzea flava]GGU79744.1 hypothetical protein GCM10010178_83280 [Lentzea flava]